MDVPGQGPRAGGRSSIRRGQRDPTLFWCSATAAFTGRSGPRLNTTCAFVRPGAVAFRGGSHAFRIAGARRHDRHPPADLTAVKADFRPMLPQSFTMCRIGRPVLASWAVVRFVGGEPVAQRVIAVGPEGGRDISLSRRGSRSRKRGRRVVGMPRGGWRPVAPRVTWRSRRQRVVVEGRGRTPGFTQQWLGCKAADQGPPPPDAGSHRQGNALPLEGRRRGGAHACLGKLTVPFFLRVALNCSDSDARIAVRTIIAELIGRPEEEISGASIGGRCSGRRLRGKEDGAARGNNVVGLLGLSVPQSSDVGRLDSSDRRRKTLIGPLPQAAEINDR